MTPCAPPRRAAASLVLVVVTPHLGCAASTSQPPPPPAVVVADERSATAATTSAPAQPLLPPRVVAREPALRCDHSGGVATIDAFLDAARAQDLASMLDCFTPELREAVRSDSAGIVRQLVDRPPAVTSHRTLSVHTAISFTNGVKEASTSRTVELSLGEPGAAKLRTVTIRTQEQPSGWFVVDVRDGAPHDATFDAIFAGATAPTEVSATLSSRGKDDLVVSLPVGVTTPPVGALVDVFAPTQSGGRAGTRTLVGVASGTVTKTVGSNLHVAVKTWSVLSKGTQPLARGAALVVQWRDVAAAAP